MNWQNDLGQHKTRKRIENIKNCQHSTDPLSLFFDFDDFLRSNHGNDLLIC